MLDQHRQAFKIECNELLNELEESLLELEEAKDNMSLISKVFRALHTIKGSGGMFGFDNISMFVHDIETIYDQIRNEEIKVTKEIIDLTLRAKDVIYLMVNDSDEEIDKEVIDDILKSLKKLRYQYAELDSYSELFIDTAKNIKTTSFNTYKIFLKFSRDIFATGTNPVSLIRELEEFGNYKIKANVEEVPAFDELNPEECYTSFELLLTTDKCTDDVRDVFIFVDDKVEIEIESVQPEVVNYELADENTYEEPEVYFAKAIEHKEETKTIHEHTEQVSSIRVNSDKLDYLVNLVSELVIVQARLTQTTNKFNDNELSGIAEEVERLTSELRDSALNIRMLPIGSTFNKFKRLVRDLSAELSKKVELVTHGAETELDKTVIEKLNDPLVHIIRNCIDHGIETPQERINSGKDDKGIITLTAEQSGGYVYVKVKDDGKGLDKDKIRNKAIEKGIISETDVLTEKEIYQLICKPGFSTASKLTSVSGRGVGMDVVQQAINNLKGNIIIESVNGEGTTITLKLPLTLAIIDGLLVKIESDYFILPLSSTQECIELTKNDIIKSNGRHLVDIRGEIVPYINLREVFLIEEEIPELQQVVIVEVKGERVGFVVDTVIGQHQTVLKNLGKMFRDLEGISGATILGDGTVALIVDIENLKQKQEIEELKAVI